MAKTLYINLEFNANTTRAKQQVADLQTQLNKAISAPAAKSLNLTPQIQQAQLAATQLKTALNAAVNTDTGKLNLNKFQAQLNQSGMNLKQLSAQMRALGPEGIKGFGQLSTMIAQADTRMFSLSGRAKSFLTSITHSAKYQLASTMVMGVLNSFKQTINYAEQLNTSLSKIRQITGMGTAEMARFAKEANEAAKALSTTTTAYTDAALIYYQQGLKGQELKEKTEATIKMANVTGQSAQTVSEWMTGIWNNFDDGSKKLEYYADVLAKLGATTASSASEIATGLEKFAAIADTVGLSYEYAASALATVTAETRQSADVVGTAFKTIFARMEGLKLGDTLEDGTTLNQYSLALEKVGVSIKDANGEIKTMDTILEQTGARWEQLNRDEQIALAQSVAGIRQYSQFMALMDNWDFMKQNLETTNMANNALEEQQNIYNESVAAAKKRMSAAGEEMKSILLNGDDMVAVYEKLADVLETIATFVDSFGGLKTIVLGLVYAFMQMQSSKVTNFFSEMGVHIHNVGEKLKWLGTFGKKGSWNPMLNMKKEATILGSEGLANQNNASGVLESKHLKQRAELQQKLLDNQSNMSDAERQVYEWRLKIIESYQKEIEKAEEAKAISESRAEKANEHIINSGYMASGESQKLMEKAQSFGKGIQSGQAASNIVASTSGLQENEIDRTQIANQVHERMAYSGKAYAEMGVNSNYAADSLGAVVKDQAAFNQKMADPKAGGQGLSAYDAAVEQLETEFKDGVISVNDFKNKLDEINSIMQTLGQTSLNSDKMNAIAVSNPDDRNSRAFKMANLSEDASIKDMKSVVGSGGNMKVESEELGTTTFNKEAADIEAKSAQNAKDLAAAKGQVTKAQNALTAAQNRGEKDLSKYNNRLSTAKQRVADLQKNEDKLAKRTDNLRKAVKKQGTELRKQEATKKRSGKSTQELIDGNKDAATSIDTMTESAIKNGQEISAQEAAIKNLDATVKSTGENIDNRGAGGLKSYASSLTSVAQAGVGVLMGMNMLSSSIENVSYMLAKGTGSTSDWIGAISSLGMSMLMILPNIAKMGKSVGNLTQSIISNHAQKKALQATQQKDPALATKTVTSDKKMEASSKKKGIASGLAAILGIAEDAGKGPSGWAIAAASAAIVIPLLAMGHMAMSSISAGKQQAKEEELNEAMSKGVEDIETINQNQELAESVDELTEEYADLQRTGQSTTEVLKKMTETIPDLIKSYKNLVTTLGLKIDTSELERAYEYFLQTGDTTAFELEKDKIDDEVEENSVANANATATTAAQVASGKMGNGKALKGSGEAGQILEEELGSYWSDKTQTLVFNENAGTVLDVYNKMVAARNRLAEQGLEDSEAYKTLTTNISAASEAINNLNTASQELYDTQSKEFLEKGGDSVTNRYKNDISSLEDYEKVRSQLIKDLQTEYKWSEANAIAYLRQTEALGAFEDGLEFFGKRGEETARTIQIKANMEPFETTSGKVVSGLEYVQAWYNSLPIEDRTLAMGIDFSQVHNSEDLKAALDEQREIAARAAIADEAVKAGFEKSDLLMYSGMLSATNSELKKNSSITDSVALSAMKLNKGLSSLQKEWKNISKVLHEANQETPEFAQALAKVHDSIEEAFGISVSPKFITTNLELIEDFANGNVNRLEELRDLMAEDYVMNLQISSFSINDTVAVAIEEGRQALLDMLNSDELNSAIEVGKGTTLSGDYLDTIQQMIDSGQLAEDELRNIMRSKGYELEITGWKEVEGPKSKIIETTQGWNGKPKQRVIERQEMISVPIINGEGTAIKGSAAPATVVKGPNSSNINLSNTNEGDSVGESSEDKAKRAKDLDKELKRYRLIDEQIQDLERNTRALEKARDRAYGPQKLAYMKKIEQAMKDETKAAEERLRQAEEYLKLDRDELAQYGVEIDSEGQVTNWDQRIQEQIDKMKSMDSKDEEYSKEEQKLKDMTTAYDNYMKTLDELKDAQQTVIDKQYELEDAALERVQLQIDLRVEASEFDLSILEHQLSRIEDNAFSAAEAIGIIGQQMATTIAGADLDQSDIREALGVTLTPEEVDQLLSGNPEGVDVSKLTEKQVEMLKEYNEQLLNAESSLREQHKLVHEKLSEAYTAYNEELDKAIEKFDRLNGVVENYKNIIDLVGKDRLGIDNSLISTMYATQKQIAGDKIASAKAAQEFNQKAYDDIKARYEQYVKLYGKDSETAREWKARMEEAEAELNESTDALNEALQNSIQLALDAFAAEIEMIADNFERSIAGIYENLENVQTAFERQQKINERYLSDYEKTYEINKLNRQMNQELSKITSTKSSQELRSLQAELLKMNEKNVNVSKRDMEMVQKKYKLLLAEQALREAQNAKSQVKLSRDTEGNYNYVYTADQNVVDQTTQAYEDAKYELEKFGDETLNEISQQVLQIQQEYSEAIRAIMEDTTLSDQQMKAKLNETTKFYQDELRYWTSEAEKMCAQGAAINAKYNANMAHSIHQSLYGQIFPDLESWDQLYYQVSDNMNTSSLYINQAISQLSSDIHDYMETAGYDMDTFAKQAYSDFHQAAYSSQQLTLTVHSMVTNMSSDLQHLLNTTAGFEHEFNKYMNSLVDNIEQKVMPALEAVIGKWQDAQGIEQDTKTDLDFSSVPDIIDPTDNPTWGMTDWEYEEYWRQQENKKVMEGITTTYAPGEALYAGRGHYGTSPVNIKYWETIEGITAGRKPGQNQNTNVDVNKVYVVGYGMINKSSPNHAGEIVYTIQTNENTGIGYILEDDLEKWAEKKLDHEFPSDMYYDTYFQQYDTGGYTGEWGPEGKLAMLHQKEIVLNAHDTENLLSIVSMVRDMNDRIELNARAMQYGLTAAYTANNIKSQNDTLQQEVHITAEFPNATNHSEIEEAFRNLTNLASQYANRKF